MTEKTRMQQHIIIPILCYTLTVITFILITLRYIPAFRRYVAGGIVPQDMLSRTDMSNKTVVITGGNRGIGYETAKVLYSLGAHVIILCRDTVSAKHVVNQVSQSTNAKPSSRIEYMYIDLSDLNTVRECAQELLRKNVQINTLINNAGVMMPPHDTTKQGLEIQFGVNYVAHFLLVKLLEDNLLRNNARIINTSSIAHTMYWYTNPFRSQYIRYNRLRSSCLWPFVPKVDLYSQSKWAMILFSRALQKRIDQSGSKATTYSLHPGSVLTDLPRYVPRFVMFFVTRVKYYLLKTPYEGAQTTIYLAIAPDIERYKGEYFYDCKVQRATEASYNDYLAEELWRESEKLVKDFI